MMILPLLAAVSISNADDSFNFTHTYVANATVHLTLDIGGLPNNAKMTSDLKEEVKSVDATGATIKFTGKLNPPTPDEGVDNFTSHVGVNGYPETGNINSVAAPFIFLG